VKGRADVRGAIVAAAAAALCAAVPPTQARSESGPMRAAFAADMFSDLAVPEAVSALTVWLDGLSRRHGLGDHVEVTVRSDLDSVAADFAADRLEVAVVRSPAYLRLRSRAKVEPLVAGAADGGAEVAGMLVVGPQSTAAGLDDLQGRGLVALDTPAGGVTRLWLETQVMKRGYANLEAFFGSVKTVPKASQVVLPVFFGQAAAGIVDETSLRVIGELNPQVVRDVKVLLAAPPLLAHLICIRADLDRPLRAELAQALIDMKDDPRGQQTLALFKTKALSAFDPAWLDGISGLVAEHAALEAAMRKRSSRPRGEPR
jgi:ABC-type phosphate/phosphonate transport system substrate-binding protein